MSEIEEILATVEKVQRRIRGQRAWKGLWFGLLLCAALWTLATALYKISHFRLAG